MTNARLKKIFKKIFPLVIIASVFLPEIASASLWSIISKPGELKMFLGNALMSLFASLLGLAGNLLNYAMEYTLNMKEIVANVGVVDIGWKLFRDLSNMAFIFVLLYIALSTILGIGNYKKMLINVVIAALLINFSLFATNIVIDASNIIANAFYQPMANAGKGGISGKISSSLRLNTIYKYDKITGKASTGGGLGEKNIFTITIMGSIFMMVTAFTFFAVSIMLIARVAILMILMVLSPLAFLSFVLPGLKEKVFNKWWSTLVEQSFFAPIFMALLYVVVSGISSEAFRSSLAGASNSSFSSAFTGGAQMMIVLNFVLIIALMITALNIAKSMSGAAGTAAVGFGHKIRKVSQRHTIGRAMHGAGNVIARGPLGNTALGKAAVTGLDAGGGADYAKWQKGYTNKGKAYDKRASTQSERQKRKDRERMNRAKASGSPERILDEEEIQKKAKKTREEKIAERRMPGLIGGITGKIAGTAPMDREIAEEMGRLSAKSFNEALDQSKKNYENENDLKGKEKAVKEAAQEFANLNQAYAMAKANGGDTTNITAEISVAKNNLDTAEGALKPIKDALAGMEKRRKKEGPKEPDLSAIMSAVKDSKNSDSGDKKA